MIEKRIFVSCDDHDIPMVITYPSEEGQFPCMLLLHGYMSYKEGDGYLFTKTAQELAKLILLLQELIFVVWAKIVIQEFIMEQKYV